MLNLGIYNININNIPLLFIETLLVCYIYNFAGEVSGGGGILLVLSLSVLYGYISYQEANLFIYLSEIN